MAVYVVPRRNVYGGVLGNLGNGLFDHLIGGMFARDANARAARRSRALYADAAESMRGQPGLPQPDAPRPEYDEDVRDFANSATRKGGLYDTTMNPTDNAGWTGLWDSTVGLGRGTRPGREALLGVFGRHGVTENEAKQLMDFYKNQFETADKLGYQDDVARRVDGLDYNVRSNPARAVQSGVTAQAYGLAPEKLFDYAYPNITAGTIDNGDANMLYRMNPATGEMATQDYAKGVDPTAAYESDAKVRAAQVNQAPRFSPIYGPTGEVFAFNDRTGNVHSTGAFSYPRYGAYGSGSGAQGEKPMTMEQRLKLAGAARDYIQPGSTPEEIWNQIVSVAGDDKEALRIMANAVFGSAQFPRVDGIAEAESNPYYGRYPAEAVEFMRSGGIRPSGGIPALSQPDASIVAEAREAFPRETEGLSDEEVWKLLVDNQ